jgi:hypothetical protein
VEISYLKPAEQQRSSTRGLRQATPSLSRYSGSKSSDQAENAHRSHVRVMSEEKKSELDHLTCVTM